MLKSRWPGAAAIALLTFLGAPFAGAETLIVGKSLATAEPELPANIGAELSIFKRHGLDLKIVDFRGGGSLAQGMAAGAIDIADGSGTEMADIVKGVPMIAVCENTGPLPFLSVAVPFDSSVRSADGLRGKKIGVTSAGSLTEWLVHELERQKGWPAGSVTTTSLGGSTGGIVAAMRLHLVDAFIGGTDQALDMQDKKIARLLMPVTDFEGSMASGVLFASNRLVAAHPEALRAFLAAWIETIGYMMTHKTETVRIESRITGFSESVMARGYDIEKDMWIKDCRFDAPSLATLERSFIDLKVVKTALDMSKLYTEAFLPK
jgi:ABC-type nitrate/sulfonate/bicarbonate transport system substrate-binding protein